jgi:hypothetical protein
MENNDSIKDKAPGVQTGALQQDMHENPVHFHRIQKIINQKNNLILC